MEKHTVKMLRMNPLRMCLRQCRPSARVSNRRINSVTHGRKIGKS